MSVNKYLKEPGVKLVNKYAELRKQKTEFENKISEDIDKVKEALFKYAEKEKIEIVAGSDMKARIKIYEKLSFPSKGSQERLEVDKILKKAGKWNEVSVLDAILLSKIVVDNKWDSSMLKKLEKFQSIEEKKQIYLSKV